MANEETILSAVDSYLAEDARYAILLDGEWGCGKSRFVETVLRPHLLDYGWELVHASLFGVSSTSELYERIVGALFRGGAGKLDGEAGDNGVDLPGLLLGTASGVIKKKMGIDVTLSSSLAASLIQWDDKLLVLDDLERRGSGFTDELFGVVNDLVENRGARVLFVCNVRQDDIATQAVEKLIWHRMRFEPSVGQLVRDILGESLAAYPEELKAERMMVSAAGRIPCNNARAFLKVRHLVDLIRASGFPDASWIDASRRRRTLSDVFRYALCGALMTGASREPVKPEGLPEINLSDLGSLSGEADFEAAARWKIEEKEREEYLELDFLGEYFEGGVFDTERALYVLEGYTDSHYPSSEVRDAAERAECDVRTRPLEDDEARRALGAILAALAEQDLALGRVPDMLAAIERLANWGIAGEFDVEEALDDAKKLARAYPEEAKRSLLAPMPIVHAEPVFDWQNDIHIVEDYVEYLRTMDSSDLTERLATAIEKDDESSAELAAKTISEILADGEGEPQAALLQPELLARAFAISNMESLCSLRGAVNKLFKRLSCDLAVVPQLLEWLLQLRGRLECVSISSTMRNYCRLLTIRDIEADIEDLEELWAASTGARLPLVPMESCPKDDFHGSETPE